MENMLLKETVPFLFPSSVPAACLPPNFYFLGKKTHQTQYSVLLPLHPVTTFHIYEGARVHITPC